MKLIHINDLKSEFSDIEDLFDKFTKKYPEFDKLEMVREILRGESVLWVDDRFFAIGRPNVYHTKTVFLIEAAAGEGLDWLPNMAQIERDIKGWGYEELEFYGRLGWRSAAKEQGYTPVKMVMRKSL